MLAELGLLPVWQIMTCVVALGAIGMLAAANRRLRQQKLQLIAALDHMSQGLCM